MCIHKYIYIDIKRERERERCIMARASQAPVAAAGGGALGDKEVLLFGGTTCLTLLVYRSCSSKAANDIANHGDP